MSEEIDIRLHGEATLPTLVYLPGLHGDWTLITAFRAAVAGRVRFVEITYPRTITWTMAEYGRAINDALVGAGISSGWLLAESFGSQPAWELMDLSPRSAKSTDTKEIFQVKGLILAAGFVKHPFKQGPTILQLVGRCVPMGVYRAMVKAHSSCIRWHHRRLPEVVAAAREFAERRTEPDRKAMQHRLALLGTVQIRARRHARRVCRFIIWRVHLIPLCRGRWCAAGSRRIARVIGVERRCGWRIIMCWELHRPNVRDGCWIGWHGRLRGKPLPGRRREVKLPGQTFYDPPANPRFVFCGRPPQAD